MPKPLIDENDPDLVKLNEVLVDFITRNLSKVSSKTLMFADVLGLLLSPIGIIVAFVKSIFILIPLSLFSLLLTNYFEVFDLTHAILLSLCMTVVFSKQLRHLVWQIIFKIINLMTVGSLIRIIARGYQANEPTSHSLLKSESPFFSLLGSYAETMDSLSRRRYHAYIDAYQESRYGDKEKFNAMIFDHWGEAS